MNKGESSKVYEIHEHSYVLLQMTVKFLHGWCNSSLILGYRQVARHETLTLAFGSSNLPIPAKG